MTEPCRVKVTGPLVPYSTGLWQQLCSLGYSRSAAEGQLRLLAHLSRWLDEEGISPEELTLEVGQCFLRARRAAGYVTLVSPCSLAVPLAYLRGCGVAPQPVVVVAVHPGVDGLVKRYASYLVDERGLAEGTVKYYLEEGRVFLAEHADSLVEDLEQLTAAQVNDYVVRGCADRSVNSAKRLATSMRSLLRFLFVKGFVNAELAAAVPTVAGWRPALPPVLERGWVERLLDSCDRATLVGSRDYALLLVLSRLGLRAGEVAALGLDDVAWRAGELLIPGGKTRRRDGLPLPADVGAALADYLRRPQDRGGCRSLFLRVVAPRRGLSSNGVKQVVRHACGRAGLPGLGAHRLRHFAATEVLRSGGGLVEIAQLLRHRSISTSAVYAKVDRDGLRTLAQPWPGGVA